MENRRGLARIQSWCFRLVLAVGLAGTLFRLARRTQRPITQPQDLEEDEAPHDLARAAASQGRPARQAEFSYSLRDLVDFVRIGLFGFIFIASCGGVFLAAGIHESGWVNPTTVPATASVLRSWAVGDQGDAQIYAYVRFTVKSGEIVHTQIEPNTTTVFARGQKIPILYNPNKPHEAGYAGFMGDSVYGQGALSSGQLAFFFASVCFTPALILLLNVLWDLMGIMRTDLTDSTTPVRLRISRGMAYADHISGTYGLEWRLMDRSGAASAKLEMVGDVHIFGRPAAGRMLVVRLADGQLVWPGSRAQAALPSGNLRLPEVEPGSVGSVQLVLAGYAQVVDLLSALPMVIRRPPGAQTEWWGWFGALRPAVKTLVTLHLRRRLDELNGALLRNALLCKPGSQSRRLLTQASEDCQAFARTLPRHNLLAVLVTITATGMTIISPFLLLPHIPLGARTFEFMLPIVAAVLILGTAPLYMFFRSMEYKRALFSPGSISTGRLVTESPANTNTGWDVYELERVAFDSLAAPQPVEWESQRSVRWLIGVIYLVPLVIGFALVLPLPTVVALGAAAISFAVLRGYRWVRDVLGPQSTSDQSRSAGSVTG